MQLRRPMGINRGWVDRVQSLSLLQRSSRHPTITHSLDSSEESRTDEAMSDYRDKDNQYQQRSGEKRGAAQQPTRAGPSGVAAGVRHIQFSGPTSTPATTETLADGCWAPTVVRGRLPIAAGIAPPIEDILLIYVILWYRLSVSSDLSITIEIDLLYILLTHKS